MEVIQDAHRFVMYHKSAIESSPLQAYGALLFSPTRSVIRVLFKDEEPKRIVIKPGMQERWSSCLQTLEGHSSIVTSVAFSHDSTWLASASYDRTVKVWSARSGECLQTFEGHSDFVSSVAFSHDSTRLASASGDWTIKVWDTRSGECLQTLEGHSDPVMLVVFSHGSTWLASASCYGTVKVWDLDRTVKVRDARSGECLQTLESEKPLRSISFDSSDKYLRTDIGVIDISALLTSTPAINSASTKLSLCQGLALSASASDVWITYNTKNLLWLPSEYRPYCSTVSGEFIAFGVESGRLWWICEI